MPPTPARPPIHVIDYGDFGSGKSTFARTFPKPLHVFMFDPIGKETPYLKLGTPGDLVHYDDGTMAREVVDRRDPSRLLAKIVHFLDADPQHPTAYAAFLSYMAYWRTAYAAEGWGTAIIDSVTFMELTARKHQQYVINPRSKEPRQWFAGSTDALEEMLMMTFGSLPINVVVIAHVDEDKDEVNGAYVRNPSAPGRVKKRFGAAFAELYRSYVVRSPEGERVYLLQTRADNQYAAATQIDAPDPCEPHYAQLWANVDAEVAR